MLCIGSLGPPSWSQPWTFSNKSWECQQLRHAETKGFEPNVWAILPLMGAVFFVLRSTKIGFTLSLLINKFNNHVTQIGAAVWQRSSTSCPKCPFLTFLRHVLRHEENSAAWGPVAVAWSLILTTWSPVDHQLTTGWPPVITRWQLFTSWKSCEIMISGWQEAGIIWCSGLPSIYWRVWMYMTSHAQSGYLECLRCMCQTLQKMALSGMWTLHRTEKALGSVVLPSFHAEGPPEFGHVTGITCNGPFKTAWSKTMVGYDLEVSSLSVGWAPRSSGMWA